MSDSDLREAVGALAEAVRLLREEVAASRPPHCCGHHQVIPYPVPYQAPTPAWVGWPPQITCGDPYTSTVTTGGSNTVPYPGTITIN